MGATRELQDGVPVFRRQPASLMHDVQPGAGRRPAAGRVDRGKAGEQVWRVGWPERVGVGRRRPGCRRPARAGWPRPLGAAPVRTLQASSARVTSRRWCGASMPQQVHLRVGCPLPRRVLPSAAIVRCGRPVGGWPLVGQPRADRLVQRCGRTGRRGRGRRQDRLAWRDPGAAPQSRTARSSRRRRCGSATTSMSTIFPRLTVKAITATSRRRGATTAPARRHLVAGHLRARLPGARDRQAALAGRGPPHGTQAGAPKLPKPEGAARARRSARLGLGWDDPSEEAEGRVSRPDGHDPRRR
jgi:hypothetical protein